MATECVLGEDANGNIRRIGIDVLGSLWCVEERAESDDKDLKDADGYCDYTERLCVVDNYKDDDGKGSLKNLAALMQKNIRHELIHAFLWESGLSTSAEWAVNESMVDWFAIQFPKLLKAFEEADCL